MSTLKLNKFNIHVLSVGIRNIHHCIIIGQRAVGKTRLAMDILQHLNIPDENKNIHTNVPSEIYLYSQTFPHANLYKEGFDAIHLEEAGKRQRNKYKQFKNLVKNNLADYTELASNIEYYAVTLLDNCVDESVHEKWYHEHNVKKLIFNGKIYRHSLIMTMSYPMRIPLVFRLHIDYLFVFSDSCPSNREKLWQGFISFLRIGFAVFNQLMDQLNQPYECYVFHLSSNSYKLEDVVFLYNSETLG